MTPNRSVRRKCLRRVDRGCHIWSLRKPRGSLMPSTIVPLRKSQRPWTCCLTTNSSRFRMPRSSYPRLRLLQSDRHWVFPTAWYSRLRVRPVIYHSAHLIAVSQSWMVQSGCSRRRLAPSEVPHPVQAVGAWLVREVADAREAPALIIECEPCRLVPDLLLGRRRHGERHVLKVRRPFANHLSGADAADGHLALTVRPDGPGSETRATRPGDYRYPHARNERRRGHR